MIRGFTLLLAASLLGGCATRGAIDIACDGFETQHRVRLGRTALENDIRNVAEGSERVDLDVFRGAMAESYAAGGDDGILLLSGGGQWGAFGAGFLGELHRKGRLPPFRIVTGVSTGGLQSLFLAASTDEAFERLAEAYAPAGEAEIVDRNPQWQVAVKGSLAGLKPLRKRIEQALCGDFARPCLMDQIASSGRHAFIGFVEAESGDFYFVDAAKLAALPDRRMARACLTGAALASAAIPVFLQQVRINGRTYYDGGVRLSVFEARIAKAAAEMGAERAQARLKAAGADIASLDPPARAEVLNRAAAPVFVVRNGTTGVPPDAAPNRRADAITNALRAQILIANQMDLFSIAALRLENPVGPLYLVTADGFDQPIPRPGGASAGRCAPDDARAMFDPGFMRCLADFGRAKAERNVEWIALREVAVAEPPRAATP